MRRAATLSIGLLATAAAALAPATSAAPEALGQVRAFPGTAFYHGAEIGSADAIAKAKACALVGGMLLCFDSEDAARAAGSALVSGPRPMRGGGVPEERCDPPAALYEAPDFDTSGGNRVLLFYDRGYWQSLVGSPYQFGGQTSSWKSGCAGAYVSVNGGGGAPKLGLGAGRQQARMPSGWDDRANAVRRCPC